MDSLANLVRLYSYHSMRWRYYVAIMDKAKRNLDEHPDISIECCLSLLQGISKTIVHELQPSFSRQELRNMSVQRQVKKAMQCIREGDNELEIAFPTACENLTRIIAELRNDRADISHGQHIPKEIQSDANLSRLIYDFSEALLRYMVSSYFIRTPPSLFYEENPKFNEDLDQQGDRIGRTPYSQLLYENDYDAYIDEFDRYIENGGEPG